MLCRTVFAFVLAGLAAFAWSAEKPKLPAGADKKPTVATGEKVKLANGLIEFVTPEGWTEAPANKTPLRNVFTAPKHDAALSVEVLPPSMQITPDMADSMMKKMRQTRQANGQKFVDEPKVEKDDRWIIRIRERYQVKDKVADQLHLYRAVGPRVVLVTINSLAGEEGAKEHDAVGEQASLSAEYIAPKKGK